jgi:hypothetical protein
MNVKPLQDMLLAEPELSRLGRQDIYLKLSIYYTSLYIFYFLLKLLFTFININDLYIFFFFENWQDYKKSLSLLV